MAIQIQGNSGTVADVAGTGFRALKVQMSPVDYGALGAYAYSHLSGTMAAGLAGNSEIFQFRWTDATRLCLINSVTIDGVSGSATAFTAGFGNFQLFLARSWTGAGTLGTTATLTGNNQKLRTNMGTTLVGEIRHSSTAALGAGTKVLDGAPVGQIGVTFGTAVSVQYLDQVYLHQSIEDGGHPLVLAQNEGFMIRATVPATGTWQWGATVSWTEVTAF